MIFDAIRVFHHNKIVLKKRLTIVFTVNITIVCVECSRLPAQEILNSEVDKILSKKLRKNSQFDVLLLTPKNNAKNRNDSTKSVSIVVLFCNKWLFKQ